MATPRQLWRAVRGDGCTNAPEFSYHDCCNDHDRRYTLHANREGRALTRAEADLELFACMNRHGKIPLLGTHIVPAAYWCAVRLFGGKHWERPPA